MVIMQLINLDNLEEAVKTAPQYTKLFIGLSQIDKFVKQIVKDTILNQSHNPDAFYIKTQTDGTSYVLSIYYSENDKIINYTWPMPIFLSMCQDKCIEYEIQEKTLKMINDLSKK